MTNNTKPSQFLTWREGRQLFDSSFLAFCIGRPLNRFITVHWESAGVTANVHEVQTRFLHSLNDWCRYRVGIPSCYEWVLENPVLDEQRRGLHAHFLAHVPDDHWTDFRKQTRPWLEAAGAEPKPRVIVNLTLNGWGKLGPGEEYLHWDFGLLHRLRYLSKGIDPDYARFFGITDPVPQGEVLGRRSGRSEALNPNRCTWPIYSYSRYPGIRLPGAELRRLRWLRTQTRNVLPDITDETPSLLVALRGAQSVCHQSCMVGGKWQPPATAP